MKRLLVCAMLLCFSVRALACNWDMDTLAMEAKGVPDAVKVIEGRFERNPPQYYQMRLERVERELQTNPDNLENYDNAGVACDRLSRSDEAIAWMQKKRIQMDKLKSQRKISDTNFKEHHYRYLANIGTFHAHRWLGRGANRSTMGDLDAANVYIKAAIKLNPDAHFGREKYQLMAIEWILHPPKVTKDDSELPTLLGDDMYKEPDKAEKGLRGLIVLGNGWESIDIFNALGAALATQHKSVVGYLAHLRALELVDQGKKSVIPSAPTGEALKTLLNPEFGTVMLSKSRRPEVAQQFRELRDEAERWHNHRTAFMQARFKAGQHPDTHPDFWNGYQELPLPALYTGETNRKYLYIIAVAVLLSLIGLKITQGRATRRRRAM